MLYKSDLYPIFQKYTWLLPPAGVVFIILSPILIPCFLIWIFRKDIVYYINQYFSDCKDSIFGQWE